MSLPIAPQPTPTTAVKPQFGRRPTEAEGKAIAEAFPQYTYEPNLTSVYEQKRFLPFTIWEEIKAVINDWPRIMVHWIVEAGKYVFGMSEEMPMINQTAIYKRDKDYETTRKSLAFITGLFPRQHIKTETLEDPKAISVAIHTPLSEKDRENVANLMNELDRNMNELEKLGVDFGREASGKAETAPTPKPVHTSDAADSDSASSAPPEPPSDPVPLLDE